MKLMTEIKSCYEMKWMTEINEINEHATVC